MEESSTYQAILAEGRLLGAVAEAKKVLRLFGDRAFGRPDAATIAALTALPRLEELLERLPSAESWQELLGEQATGRRGRRRRSP